LDSVLKAVGDFTSTAAARVLDVLPLGPFAMALIWRDSLGLFWGLVGDGVDISIANGWPACSFGGIRSGDSRE